MNEEELLEEEIQENSEEVEEASSELSSEEQASDITDQEILDAVREVIYENRENAGEGIDLLGEPDISPAVTPTPEVVDYTQLLTDIKNQQIQTNSTLSSLIEAQEQTIFDKNLSDYNITESILVFLVVFGLGVVVVGLIKKFTPKLWR